MNYEDDDNGPYLSRAVFDAAKVILGFILGFMLMIWVAIEGRAGGW